MSFTLWWDSCRQHVYDPCFLTHSGAMSLNGVSRPFTLKVVIDRYVFIATLFIYLCSSVFVFFFNFLLKKTFTILVILVLW